MTSQGHRGISVRGREILIASFIVAPVATILVVARFVARRQAGVGYKSDDWFIVAALASAWAMASLRAYVVFDDGLGYHQASLPPDEPVDFQKAFLAIQATYFSTAVLTKTSILLLYRRIFDVNRRFVYAVWTLLALTASYFVICLLVSILGCRPISYFWNKAQDGSCINETQFFRWNGIANIILDVIVLLMPLPPIWQLQMSVKQKLGLSGIFLLGSFACVASAFRIIQFEKSRQSDPTFTTPGSIMWSHIEQTVGIMCACLPTLRPLLRRTYWSKHDNDDRARPVSSYYDNRYLSGSSSAKSNFKTTESTVRGNWPLESDSAVELALDPGKVRRDVSIFYDDDDKSEEGSVPQDGAPSLYSGIVKTQEVTQHIRAAG